MLYLNMCVHHHATRLSYNIVQETTAVWYVYVSTKQGNASEITRHSGEESFKIFCFQVANLLIIFHILRHTASYNTLDPHVQSVTSFGSTPRRQLDFCLRRSLSELRILKKRCADFNVWKGLHTVFLRLLVYAFRKA